MRYSVRIEAHEVMGFTQAGVFLYAHPEDLREQPVREMRKFVTVEHDTEMPPEDYLRDLLVGVLEHL